MTQSRAFLEALFVGKPEELFFLLWTLPEKRSHWFRGVDAAVRFAESQHEHNLYVGVGLSGRDYGATRRCVSDGVIGIVGLWADFDLKSDAHPKEALPATVEQALSILPTEVSPSIVVLTGNGIHAWWLFKEPWVFESEQDQREAATLVNRWHTLLRDNASQRGWTYERLADLARVLRVPGTTNCKDPANPKPVTIHALTDLRFNPSEIAEYLDDLAVCEDETEAAAAREWAESFKDKPININLAARIPEDMLNRWLEADPRFRNTWFRQRADLQDQSQSGYDLALACFGFRAGLVEQQIVDLIVHHRAAHKQKPRGTLDYFQRTLAKAASRGSDVKQGPSTEGPPPGATPGDTEPSDGPAFPSAVADDERTKIALSRRLSELFEVEILRIVKLTGKEPLYRMELTAGKIEFPNVEAFTSQRSVRMAIAATVDRFIGRFKPRDWDQVAQMLLSACIVEQGGEELEYEGAALMHIRQYLAEMTFIPSIEGQLVQNIRKPLIRDDRVTLCSSDLQMFINKTTLQNLTVRAVASMLSAIGAKTVRVRWNKTREQSRWELPLSEFDPRDYLTPEEGGTHDIDG
jgi:hypothetical protein